MKILLVILGVIFLILFSIVLFVKVRLFVYVSLNRKNIYLKIGFIKIPLYPGKKKNNETVSDEKISTGIGSVSDFWKNNSGDFKKTLLRLKKRILIEKFNFDYKCGFNDAAVTAIMYGTVHALYSNLFSFFDYNFRLKEMQGSILADFDEHKKHISIDSVFCLTISDIIYIMAALLPVIKNIKTNKGGA